MIKQEEQKFTESLYDKFSLRVKSMAKYILKSEKIADKALLQTFFKAVKYRKLFYRVEKEDIRRIVVVFLRSICFGFLRKERKLEYDTSFNLPEGYLNETSPNMGEGLSVLLKKEKLSWFKDTFVLLGSPFKEICIMKFYYNMKTSEVANVLGLKKAQVESVLGKKLAKLKAETEHFIGCRISPAEMGVVIGIVSKQYIDEEIKRFESFDITRIKVLPETKKKVMKYLGFCQNRPWLFAVVGLVSIVLIAVVFLIILL